MSYADIISDLNKNGDDRIFELLMECNIDELTHIEEVLSIQARSFSLENALRPDLRNDAWKDILVLSIRDMCEKRIKDRSVKWISDPILLKAICDYFLSKYDGRKALKKLERSVQYARWYKERPNRKPAPPKCFVATATFEDDDHPIVLKLRFIRDEKLNHLFIGRLFIKLYYTVGPTLSLIPRKSSFFKNKIKRLIVYFTEIYFK